MNRGDINQAIDRCYAHDLPDAADLIASLADRLVELRETYKKLILRSTNKNESLRRVAGAAQAACKQKNRAIEEAMGWNWLDGDEEIPEEVVEMIAQAMAAQPDGSALKAWLGEPVVWQFSDNYGTHYTDDRREWYDAVGIESVMPLYAPKGMK